MIEVLLEAGADVNATGDAGETALDIALAREEDEGRAPAPLWRKAGAVIIR